MDSKPWIYALAASGLVASAMRKAEAAPQKKKESVECFGINVGTQPNGCGLSVAQAELANRIYFTEVERKDKDGKTTKIEKVPVFFKTAELVSNKLPLGECAGTADGGKDKGFLGWVNQPSKQECFKAGGFVYLKDKAGNLQIEDKTGIRKDPEQK